MKMSQANEDFQHGASLIREAPVPLREPQPESDQERPNQGEQLGRLFRKEAYQFDSTGFQGGPSAKRKGYVLALWSWIASFIDLLILISLSCAFLVCFSMIMKTSVGPLLKSLNLHHQQGIFFLQIFVVATWLYSITTRVFMGATIGEWACSLRLGKPHERLHSAYVLRVLLRSSLIVASGLIILPTLSLLLGRDLAGKLSGLQLFSLK